jgi:transposase
MEGILSPAAQRGKQRLLDQLQFLRDAWLRTRYLIIIHQLEGWPPTWIARSLKVSRSMVYRTAQRFWKEGEAGLFDRRDGNGQRKLTEEYLVQLREVVRGDPLQYGWTRPTWTRELLVRTMQRRTGIKIGLSTMSRALRLIGARRGRPKPTVRCPWPEVEKQRCLQKIKHLMTHLPANEVAVWEDEVDIHLNPKIGQDWMLRGQQKRVLTPGKNEKRYLAGDSERSNEGVDRDRRPPKEHGLVRAAVVGAHAAVPAREKDPCRPGQLCDPYDPACANEPRDAARPQAALALLATLLSRPQPDRADVAGPTRQRHTQSQMFDDAAIDAKRPSLHPPTQPPSNGSIRKNASVSQNRCR